VSRFARALFLRKFAEDFKLSDLLNREKPESSGISDNPNTLRLPEDDTVNP
jgi:hypothetical protein